MRREMSNLLEMLGSIRKEGIRTRRVVFFMHGRGLKNVPTIAECSVHILGYLTIIHHSLVKILIKIWKIILQVWNSVTGIHQSVKIHTPIIDRLPCCSKCATTIKLREPHHIEKQVTARVHVCSAFGLFAQGISGLLSSERKGIMTA